jgi:hypothetical protein
MHWYKHNTRFRDSDAMKYIMRCDGREGCGMAYRLLEVGAQHCDEANEFSSTIILEGVLSKDMLALDVMGNIEDDYGARPAVGKDLEPYLVSFETAGLIERGTVTTQGSIVKDGKRVPCMVTLETIRFVGLEDCIDVYTQRVKRKQQARAAKAKKSKAA